MPLNDGQHYGLQRALRTGSSFIMKISFALALLIDEAVIIMTPDLVEWAEIKLVAKDQKEGMPNVIECFGLLRPGREARGQDHHQHPDICT